MQYERETPPGVHITFGPVLIPGANIPINSWLPRYPDAVRAAASVLVAAVPFFFAPVAPVSAAFNPATVAPFLSVTPQPYPARRVNMSMRLGPSDTAAAVAVSLDWLPQYPDRVARFNPPPPAASTFDPFPIPAAQTVLGWGAAYPSALAQPRSSHLVSTVFAPFPVIYGGGASYPLGFAQPRPTQIPEIFDPLPPRLTLGWKTVYPDTALRAATIQPQSSSVEPFPRPNTIQLGWGVYAPEAVYRPRPTQPASTVFHPVPLIQLGWKAIYPDTVIRHPATQPLAFTINPLPRPAVLFVAPVYPHWLPARQLPPSVFTSIVAPPAVAAVRLQAWAIYPDRPERRVLPVGAMPFWFWDPKFPFVPVVVPAWVSVTYPSGPFRRDLHPARMPFFAFDAKWVAPPIAARVEYVEQNIRRLRRAPHVSDGETWLFYTSLQIDLEAGIGNDTTTCGPGYNPQVMLRWSDDDGDTWSNEHWVSAGLLGEYQKRALWRRLGRARDRIYEVVVTDPNAWQIIAAYLDVTKGTS